MPLAIEPIASPLQELDTKNTAIGVVGKGIPFTIITGDAVAPYLAAVGGAGDGVRVALRVALVR